MTDEQIKAAALALKEGLEGFPALVEKQGNLRRPLQVHIDVNIVEGAHQPAAFGAFDQTQLHQHPGVFMDALHVPFKPAGK